jgi:hypothetical protein
MTTSSAKHDEPDGPACGVISPVTPRPRWPIRSPQRCQNPEQAAVVSSPAGAFWAFGKPGLAWPFE